VISPVIVTYWITAQPRSANWVSAKTAVRRESLMNTSASRMTEAMAARKSSGAAGRRSGTTKLLNMLATVY